MKMRNKVPSIATILAALALVWPVPARTASHDDDARSRGDRHGDGDLGGDQDRREPDDVKQHHAKLRADKIRELYHDVEFPNSVQVITGQKSVADIFAPDVR